jgi:hypothetical protein
METTFYSLASKENFNKALRHFYSVNDVVEMLESNRNIADVINELTDDNDLMPDQILPIMGAVIKEKFNYSYNSFTIPAKIEDFSKITTETNKWTALDIAMVYYNPRGSVVLLNPKTLDSGRVQTLAQDQLLVIYAKFLKEDNAKVEKEAITAIEEMIAGKDIFINKEFIDSTKVAKAAPKPTPEQKKKKKSKNATPLLAVMVSNELFHNGNVEAWKKIIESFQVMHKDLDVFVYFDGEIVNDLNSLFKWGKVKHADSIFFQVAGENIRNVSKLKKYLFEGASPRYEQFLKAGIGQVLNLF